MKKKPRIFYNAPVTLTFAITSFIILVITALSGARHNNFTANYFTLYRIGFDHLGQYTRLVLYTLGHAGFDHFVGNMSLFLLLGPIVEEKYGSGRLFMMIVATAVVSGLIHLALNPHTGLLGASGIVFMLVILCAVINFQGDKIPLSFILVVVMWIGKEFVSAFTVADNVSRLGHIMGGICGGGFGFLFYKEKKS